jgi:hypothetical protein
MNVEDLIEQPDEVTSAPFAKDVNEQLKIHRESKAKLMKLYTKLRQALNK